jgi:hypothetical protein
MKYVILYMCLPLTHQSWFRMMLLPPLSCLEWKPHLERNIRPTRNNHVRSNLLPLLVVGSAYTPDGKVDIAALKKAPPPAVKPTLPSSSSRPAFGSVKPTISADSVYGRTVNPGSAPADAWPEDKPSSPSPAAAPPPLPAASRPQTFPTTSRPAFSAMVCICK